MELRPEVLVHARQLGLELTRQRLPVDVRHLPAGVPGPVLDDLPPDTRGEPQADRRVAQLVQSDRVQERHPYDANAVAVATEHGVVGYLARDEAKSYQAVLQLLESHGYRGGACAAYGLRADNGMWGVVLVLSGARKCMDHVKVERSFRAY